MPKELVPKITACIGVIKEYLEMKGEQQRTDFSAEWAKWRLEYNKKNPGSIAFLDGQDYVKACSWSLITTRGYIEKFSEVLPEQAANIKKYISVFSEYVKDSEQKKIFRDLLDALKSYENVNEKKPEVTAEVKISKP